MFLYRYLKSAFLVVILILVTSCNTESNQSVDYTELSSPVQSLVETVLTYHAHNVILELHSDRSGQLSLHDGNEWLMVAEFNSLEWRSVISESTLVHELFSEFYLKINDSTSVRLGQNRNRPFYIQENKSGAMLNGPADFKIRFEDYTLYLSIHYQDVFITHYAFESELSGKLFYTVRFFDKTNQYAVQMAKGSVDFNKESIQMNDLEYRFNSYPDQHAQVLP